MTKNDDIGRILHIPSGTVTRYFIQEYKLKQSFTLVLAEDLTWYNEKHNKELISYKEYLNYMLYNDIAIWGSQCIIPVTNNKLLLEFEFIKA